MICIGATIGANAADNDLLNSEWGYGGLHEPFIRFEADGRLVGHGGCNAFFGSWQTPETGKLSIGPLAGTKKMCAAEIMAEEVTFMRALEGATGFRILDGRLELFVDGLPWTEMQRRVID